MAELGVAAAILQIAQLLGQVALKTHSIANKLKHAPRVIKSNLSSVNDFTYMLRALESALIDRPGIRDILSNDSRAYVQELLQHCNAEATSCDTLLLPMVPQDGKVWRESWKRILSIKREEDIAQRLKNLDSLRSQLSIWYSHQIMLLTYRVDLSVTNIDDRLKYLHQGVPRGLTTLDTSIIAIDKLAHEICNGIASRPRLLADLADDSIYRKRPSHLDCRCQQMSKYTVDLNYRSIRYQSRSVEDHKPGCAYFGRTIAKTVESSLRCTLTSRCIEVLLARPQYLGRFIVIPVVDDSTAPSLERFKQAYQEVSDTLRGYRLRSPSPFRGGITNEILSQMKLVMQKLLDGLVEDLQTGKYSARDQSKRGSTLLHVYSGILVDVWHFQAELNDLIKKTVGLLVYHGADVNAVAEDPNVTYIGRPPPLYTAFSLLLKHVQAQDIVRLESTASIPRIFSKYEIPAFYGRTYLRNDIYRAGLFAKVPDLALEYGCSQLTIAVVQRDKDKVERLIRNSHNVNDTISPPYSPLCLAIGWSTGVNTLLKAGADPSFAVHCAIVYEDEVTLKSLLDSGSRLAATAYEPSWTHGFWNLNDFAHSLLSFALWKQYTQRKTRHTTISLIVQALATSRQKLMDLAKKYLSNLELKRCGWNDPFNNVLESDAVATALATSIREKDIDVPPALNPSTKESVYHDESMTAPVAEELFLAGFKQVDLLDKIGQTPLLVNAHFEEHNILERSACLYWFLHHGAERVVFPFLNSKSLAHVLAANLGRAWRPEPPWEDGCKGRINKDTCQQAKTCLPVLLDRIFSLSASPQRDNCQCFCSQSGCLPVHSILNHMGPRPSDSGWPETSWPTWHDERMVLDLWSECSAMNPEKDLERSEICRLQIFNRLSMKHTCCTFSERIYDLECMSWYLSPKLVEMDDSERAQFREEDAHAKSQLDAFMKLYDELNTEFRDQTTLFWDTWWTVLDEYVPSVNWSDESVIRHVQVHDDLFPVEEQELQSRIDQIREEVRVSIAEGLQDTQEGEEGEENG